MQWRWCAIHTFILNKRTASIVLVYVIAQARMKFGINFTSCSENEIFPSSLQQVKFIPNFHSCQCYNKLIGERAKRVRHPLSLPIEKKCLGRTSKPQCACSQVYLKRRRGRACIYEKPTCCSRVQLREGLFTYVKTTTRMHIK